VTSSHPLFNVDNFGNLSLLLLYLLRDFFIRFWFSRTFKITSKVLQKCYLLLESVWVLKNIILFSNILTISCPPLDVVKMVAVWVEHNLGRIIKEYTD
jgi:hypothetical protein